jgi:3',5'-nucleoside bisphosphate phosphatase
VDSDKNSKQEWRKEDRFKRIGLGTGVEFHSHTTFSDGVFEPEQLVRNAKKDRTNLLFITDHDTLKGFLRASSEGKKEEVLVRPGTELSCYVNFEGRVQRLHLLVYYPDRNKAGEIVGMNSPTLQKIGELIVKSNKERANKLNETFFYLEKIGFHVPEEFKKKVNAGMLGLKKAIAEIIWNAPENKKIIQALKESPSSLNWPEHTKKLIQAYNKTSSAKVSSPVQLREKIILGSSPFPSPKTKITKFNIDALEFINAVKENGGFTFLAHPGLPAYAATNKMLDLLVEAGLTGIEPLHPGHSQKQIERLTKYFKRKKIEALYSSDFHSYKYRHIPNFKFSDAIEILDEIHRKAGKTDFATIASKDLRKAEELRKKIEEQNRLMKGKKPKFYRK